MQNIISQRNKQTVDDTHIPLLFTTIQATSSGSINVIQMNSSRWFDKIPLEEFGGDKTLLMAHLRATKWSSKMRFSRQARSPCSVEDLLRAMRGNHLIWLNEESLVLRKKLPKSVPPGSQFKAATAKIHFGPDKSVHVYGLFYLWSNYNFAQHARVPTTFRRFFTDYLNANSQRRLALHDGCCLSDEESNSLVSYPDAWNVELRCPFVDNGAAFVDALSKRTSDFGTLSLHNFTSNEKSSLYSCFPILSR
jgi:hypothetical protein